VTVHEAATTYKIPASTIRRWLSEGRLVVRGQPRNRRTKIDLDELDQICDIHRRPGLTGKSE